MLIVLVAILATAFGAWMSQSTFFAAVEKLPAELRDPFMSRFAVDPYIWREPALRPLRPRYAGGQALLVIAFALWALVAMPYQTVLALALAAIAGVSAVSLGYRALRHGL